jgi:mercuric reductase
VFAAGDVIGEPAFVYTAAYEGRLAAENGLGATRQARDYTALPAVVFTDPQLATVGLGEKGARERGIEVDVAKLHPYLTAAEAIKLAAQTFEKDVARLSCCAS